MSDKPLFYTLEMSLDAWVALPTHPRQRDTERHSHARHWRPAATAQGALAATLRQVTAADLDGRLYKVDGHTRTYLWQEGKLPAPESVVATVYRVRDELELLQLYNAFDTASASKQPGEKVSGAYRQHGLDISSYRLRGGQITAALGIALYGSAYGPGKQAAALLDVYDAVGVFADELVIIDRLKVETKIFASGVLATALLCLALHPDETEFWQKVSRREGTKREGLCDPVEAALAEIDQMRGEKKGVYTKRQVELAGRTMRGFLAWHNKNEEKNQYWFANRLREVDLAPYIDEVKQLKQDRDKKLF